MAKTSLATASGREGVVAAAVLAVLAAICLRPSIHGVDGVGNYVYVASILRGGDFDFTDEYAAFDEIKRYDFVTFAETPRHPATGRPANRYGIGSSLMWAPFVIAAHGVTKVFAPEKADLLGRPYEWAVGIGTAFWASLGLWLLYRRLRRDWDRAACAAAIAALIFATPLGFYIYAHGSMSHGNSFFAMVLLLIAFDRFRVSPTIAGVAALGALAALVVIIRFQDAPWAVLTAACVGVVMMKSSFSEKRNAAFNSVMFFAALIVALPQLLAWRALYGFILSGPVPYLNAEAGSFSLAPRHVLGVLFSERGGVLAWHPVIAIGLFGLIRLALRRGEGRAIALFGLAGFCELLWLVSCWSVWWAGASFGNRFFISALPFIALGLAGLIGDMRGYRRMLAFSLIAALIVWNIGLLYQYATEMIPREDEIPWTQVVKQNVIDVPRRLLSRLSS